MRKPITRPNVAIIGAGIFGLAHAWAAARRGWRVTLFDRDEVPCGASIRNFGMIWPIGQPHGVLHRLALKSRDLWIDLLREAGCWFQECGSIHLAIREDELAVLSEFAERGPQLGYECELAGSERIRKMSPAVRADSLLGGLVSQTELAVDPREAIARLPQWLQEHYGVELKFGVCAAAVESGRVSANHLHWEGDRVIIANGVDFRYLFPQRFAAAGFQRCKLQMMRTNSQPDGWRIGPMLAGGLTLRHYPTFAVCPSLTALKQRIASETPELERFGIHVMASQNGRGEVVLGDSHEYFGDITPFDKVQIEQLILAELHRLIDLPSWQIQQRWHGVYAKAPGLVEYDAEIEPEVFAAISSGGAGMTLSMGLAESHWEHWDSSSTTNADASRRETVALQE